MILMAPYIGRKVPEGQAMIMHVPYNTTSHSVANPAIEVFEFAMNTCHMEVVHPSPLNLFQLADSFIAGPPPVRASSLLRFLRHLHNYPFCNLWALQGRGCLPG